VVGARGLDTPLATTRQPWHPGFIEDAMSVVEYLIRLYGKTPSSVGSKNLKLFLVGFSAGAMIVYKTLLHYSRLDLIEKKHLVAGMIVCLGCNYKLARERLESSWSGKIYSLLMCALCKEILQKNSRTINEKLQEEKDNQPKWKTLSEAAASAASSALSSPDLHRVSRSLAKCHFLSDYDEIAVPRFHGYENEDDLSAAMSMNHFSDMKIPLMGLQPRDDPLHQVNSKLKYKSNSFTSSSSLFLSHTGGYSSEHSFRRNYSESEYVLCGN
jgi:predicted alpha/beta-fold hydrolase